MVDFTEFIGRPYGITEDDLEKGRGEAYSQGYEDGVKDGRIQMIEKIGRSMRDGDRLYSYCVACGRTTSHVVSGGSAICAEHYEEHVHTRTVQAGPRVQRRTAADRIPGHRSDRQSIPVLTTS